MKKAIIALAILIAATGSTASYAHNKHPKGKKHATAKQYTCPMHPEVVQNKPGKCPKCGMNLVAVKPKTNK
jgi:hypothetical protein